jgi:hypothetical protein
MLQGKNHSLGSSASQQGSSPVAGPSDKANSTKPSTSPLAGCEFARTDSAENPFSNLAEATLERISRMSESYLTQYGERVFYFGASSKVFLTPAIVKRIPEVEVTLYNSRGHVSTEVAIRTDSGMRRLFGLPLEFWPDARSDALNMLATLEGAVLGAAQRYGQLKEGTFTPTSSEGAARRRNDLPHTEPLRGAINSIYPRFGFSSLDRVPKMDVTPFTVSSAGSTISEGFEFSLKLPKTLSTEALLKCRIDARSPVVETHFPGAQPTIHSFETTQAAIYFILGVSNGALAAEAAQRYNSLPARLGRFLNKLVGSPESL